VVDAESRTVIAYREPFDDGYARSSRHERDAVLTVPGFDDVHVPVAALFE
jgi:hypothetical protein